MEAAEDTVSLIETLTAVIFAIILAMMLLIVFRKKPSWMPPVVLTVFSVIFIAVGIAALVINAQIYDAVNTGMSEAGAMVEDLINNIAPGLSDILTQLIGADKTSLVFRIAVYCGAGWWLSTIGIVAVTVLSFMQMKFAKKG